MIYLVERLWTDPLENHNAFGYEPIGYTVRPEDPRWKEKVCGDGWPIPKGKRVARYRVRLLYPMEPLEVK